MDLDGLTRWEDRGTINSALWKSVWHIFPKFGGEWLNDCKLNDWQIYN